MLANENKFLESLAKKSSFLDTNDFVCIHRHETFKLLVEKEHIFFNSKLSQSERDRKMSEIDKDLIGLKCSCKHTENDLRAKGKHTEYMEAVQRDDTETMSKILANL